jgi:monofunctional biosynthetic peptidoglycan transglycosylase
MAATRRKRRAAVRHPIVHLAARALLIVLVGSVGSVLLLRWIRPVTTAFMIEARVAAVIAGDSHYRSEYRWVAYREISPQLPIAVVAAEDQKFPIHAGFDFDAIADALGDRGDGGPSRGASTITQQVAKNLFLWPGRSWLRKGIEAYFTVLLETLWPKRRILEVYLNVAEFAPGTFGAGAAAQRFFGVPPSRLDAEQSARLAAVLPAPDRLHADRPSDYVRERTEHIESEAQRLGGPAYLRALSFQ